jgi:hypothetical protein
MIDRAVVFLVNARTPRRSMCLDVRENCVLWGPSFEVPVGDSQRGRQNELHRREEDDGRPSCSRLRWYCACHFKLVACEASHSA